MSDDKTKCAEAQLMIRKPVAKVFEAFVDPEITKNFWFTKGSGKLEINKEVTWEWEMYNISATVITKEIINNKKVVFEWDKPARTVEIKFRSLNNGLTFVTVSECGFNNTGDELLAAVKGSTGGFTSVLDGLKAYLEHGINLKLIADKFPKEISEHGK